MSQPGSDLVLRDESSAGHAAGGCWPGEETRRLGRWRPACQGKDPRLRVLAWRRQGSGLRRRSALSYRLSDVGIPLARPSITRTDARRECQRIQVEVVGQEEMPAGLAARAGQARKVALHPEP